MIEIKIRISDDLERKMKEHPDIDWASIASKAIKKYLNTLDLDQEVISNRELEELSNHSLKEFLENEPNIYSDQDLIKRYK